MIYKILILIILIPYLVLIRTLQRLGYGDFEYFDYVFLKPDNLGDVALFLRSLEEYSLENRKVLIIVRSEFVEIVQSLRQDVKVITLDYLNNLTSLKALHATVKALVTFRAKKLVVPVKSRYFYNTDLIVILAYKHCAMSLENDGLNAKLKMLCRFEKLIYHKVIPSNHLSEKFNIDALLESLLLKVEHQRCLTRINPDPVGAPKLVLSPFTTDTRRNLTPDIISSILDAASNAGFHMSIIGAPSDNKYYRSEYASFQNIEWQVGQTELKELPAIISNATGLISAETGTVQLAGLLNVPALVFAGGGHFGRFVGQESASLFRRTVCYSKNNRCFGCNWDCTEMYKNLNDKTYPCIIEIDYQRELNEFLERIKLC